MVHNWEWRVAREMYPVYIYVSKVDKYKTVLTRPMACRVHVATRCSEGPYHLHAIYTHASCVSIVCTLHIAVNVNVTQDSPNTFAYICLTVLQ